MSESNEDALAKLVDKLRDQIKEIDRKLSEDSMDLAEEEDAKRDALARAVIAEKAVFANANRADEAEAALKDEVHKNERLRNSIANLVGLLLESLVDTSEREPWAFKNLCSDNARGLIDIVQKLIAPKPEPKEDRS